MPRTLAPQTATTQRDEAKPSLAGSDEKFKRLSESNVVGVLLADVYGSITDANDAFLEMLGFERADLPLRWDAMTPPEWQPLDRAAVEAVLSGGAAEPWEKEYFARDGQRVPVLVAVAALLEGTEGDCMGIVLDLTERRRIERHITAQKDALQALTAELARSEEEERRRISMGLHDDVGQTLATAKLRLGELQRAQPAGAGAEAIQDIHALLDQAIEATRSLTFELSSPVLYEIGLRAALESLGERFERESGLEFQMKTGEERGDLAEDVAVVLYRVARELLHNVAKHARARTVRMWLETGAAHVRVAVEDDGVGFDAADAGQEIRRGAGFGLFSIRQQLAQLGGRLEIESAPGSGTRAVAIAPLGPIPKDSMGDPA